MRSSAGWRFFTALVVLLSLSTAPRTQPQPSPPVDLGQLFAEGPFLQDQNGDGVIDAITARIVVPSGSAPEDIAAGANLAARLGFEAAAFTPGLGVFDTDFQADGRMPLILVGRTNRFVERLVAEKKIDLAALEPGQGLVAWVRGAVGGADALIVAGADEAGTLAAGAAAAARLPYLWQLRSDSVRSVQEDVQRVLASRGLRVVRSTAIAAVYEKDKEQTTALTLEIAVGPGSEATAAAVLDEIARAHVVGQADFTDRRADTLNYHGLETLEIRFSGGRTIRIGRFGPPYRSSFPTNPWKPAAKTWSLASIYTIAGVLGDSRGQDLIPDETETTLVVGAGAGRAVGTIDLAARIALESTGVSLPLARVESEIGDASTVPNPILIGPGKLSALLPAPHLSPGEGTIRIVPRAFGPFPGVIVAGGDAAGLNAAASYFARSVPYLWRPRRGEVSFSEIEEDVQAFLRARSSAGQAAAALVGLESALDSIKGDVESLAVEVYLEEGSRELAGFIESLVKKRFATAKVTASVSSRYGPVTVFEDTPDLGWEVDELRRRFTGEVLPRIARGTKVQLEVLVSEGPEIRRQLEEEFRRALQQAGAAEAAVRVICAYKQGFSWLADYVLPALKGKPVGTVTIRFPTATPPDPARPWYGLPIRWLQELFPIDEILARELKIGVDATKFDKVDDGPIVYQVEARDRAGRVLYTDEFAPRFVEREYFPQKPTARIHYTTGGLRARVDGQVVTEFDVRTDPERFWDYYQTKALPRMFDYVREYTGGRLGAENQPFFRDLIVDITMSEPDFRLNLDEERISSLDSLHEDLMFDTIDFWSIFSGNRPGSRDVAPGRIMPMIHPVAPGKAPRVTVTFKGNAVPTPRAVLSWKIRGGPGDRRTILLADLGLPPPRATAVRVRAGSGRVASITVDVPATDARQAFGVAERVESLARIQKAGALTRALVYPGLDALEIEAGSETAKVVRAIVPVAEARRAEWPVKPVTPGQRIVTWDHVIGPAELEDEILPRLRNFPEINAYVAGRTYRGLNVWAMDVMLPIKSEIWSQAKASASKPVLLISTRQHSNEVSATSAALRLMELFATDPEYRKYLKRMNVAYHPMENPDGAANHQEFYKLQPTYILHAGYWSSVGRDVGAYVWDDDPLLPEALVRRKLYYTWLPDIYMNPHGYPSHEWVHQFAGYKVPWFLAFWIPRGYHINLHHIDDPNFPDHKPVALELRERIIEEVQGVPEIRAANERLIHRFEKYARRYEPDPFRLELYKGMNILFDHSYSFAVGGPFSREIYVNSLWGRPHGGGGGGSGEGRNFLSRHPEITVLDLGCDMPDETASPEWMEKIAARGQFGYLMAVVKLLYDSHWAVKRFEEDFRDAVRLSIFRPRPVKAARGGPTLATASR
ncbi:MAG TPA: M14 family metallopeptidase [Vicinamibacterales bacterium]|nr:M14 family metallopeptidase [Vicinamibacterales bacterium]